MAKKRQFTREEQLLWDNFTRSMDRSVPHKNVVPLQIESVALFSLSNSHEKAKTSQDKKYKSKVFHENSLFIQHYKLFKMQKKLFSHKHEAHYSIGEKRHGLDKSTWKKLQNGELKSQWRLDLHGFTAHHAFLALENFLLNAYQQHIRCVEVITGIGNTAQGGGILKRELPHWLNRPYIHSMILATSYVSASNDGAVRILLKKKRKI